MGERRYVRIAQRMDVPDSDSARALEPFLASLGLN
jgi:hypothetical protein